MAWLHHKCKKLVGYTPLCYYLESTFHDLFLEIFGDEKYKDGKFNYDRVFDAEDNLKAMNNIQDYYLSWLLRGNSPTFASDESTVPTSDIEKEWLNVSVNHHLARRDFMKLSAASAVTVGAVAGMAPASFAENAGVHTDAEVQAMVAEEQIGRAHV